MLINKNIFFLTAFLLNLLIYGNVFGMQHEHMHEKTKTDCHIDRGPCLKTVEHRNIQVLFDINPKPVTTMKDVVFKVVLTEPAKAVTDADITLDLTMPGMFMGINRPALKHVKDGVYEGKGVLPVCPHGGKTWKAEVTVKQDGRVETISYIFEVK